MSVQFEGNDCMPSISGGYLLITFDGEEVAMVSVPSPIFADRHRDSVNQNFDQFEDDNGNDYDVLVSSSNIGVDWTITVSNSKGESDLENRIVVEYLPNDY
ncbi:hypothetical protein AB4563_24050 [Vibrio splendidus]